MREDTILDQDINLFGFGDWIFGALLGVFLIVIVVIVVRMFMKSNK